MLTDTHTQGTDEATSTGGVGRRPGGNRAHGRRRRIAAVSVAAVLGFGAVACSDEDGDGSTTNEEVDQVQNDVDKAVSTIEDESKKAADEVEQQVDEGTEEPQES